MRDHINGLPTERIDRTVEQVAHVPQWETEQEAADEFDRRIEACGLFERSFKEVRGYYLAHRPNREEKDARIDRVLIPGGKLRDAGWGMTIGVEIKKSGADYGHAVSQAIDYTYCNWNVGNYWMYCERIFLWPFRLSGTALQSVMLQNGVGVVGGRFSGANYSGDSLVFQLERNVIVVNDNHQLTECHATTSGGKLGSR